MSAELLLHVYYTTSPNHRTMRAKVSADMAVDALPDPPLSGEEMRRVMHAAKMEAVRCLQRRVRVERKKALRGTLPAVVEILRAHGAPMSVQDIVDASDGMLPTSAVSPKHVVMRDLSLDIKRKGDASVFVRTAPGRFTLRALLVERAAMAALRAGTDVEERGWDTVAGGSK